jgi:large subunit ribosomal protein L5
MTRLKELYKTKAIPALKEKFNYRNDLEVPKVEKVVINMGIGEASKDPDLLEAAMEELALISGQRPVKTRAKRSIAGFKLRQGAVVGCMVTLRGDRMWEFLDRLFNLALPRVRDFRGVSQNSFDGRGNYTLGIKEQIIFPEINYDKVKKVMGMNITIVLNTGSDEPARELLSILGMPFRG